MSLIPFGRRPLLPAALAALLACVSAAPARSQVQPPKTVGVSGRLEKAGGILCGVGTTPDYRFACTSVWLAGDAALLDPFLGQLVKVVGVPDPTSPCGTIAVTAAIPAPATLEWCGTPASGCELRFVICPGGISQYWLWASGSPGFVPVSPAKGSFLLGQPTLLVGSGTGGAPCHAITLAVPPLPTLVGVDVFLQAARRDIGPIGPIELTNSVCLTLLGATGIPCILPDC